MAETMPERIYADDPASHENLGRWFINPRARPFATQYIRADIHADALNEAREANDALRKRVEELEGAVADEREACARLAETDRRSALAVEYGHEPSFHKVGKAIAEEIRARATLGGTDGR